MAADLGCGVADLLRDGAKRTKIDAKKYVTEDVGLPTLNDILAELAKPGRDPRQQFEAFSFAEGVEKMEQLQPGMKLPGIVTNVTAFGAFIDIGVHQDGLAHISQLADTFVKDPAEFVKPGQRVMVTVTEVDLPRKRIALSMKSKPDLAPRADRKPGEASPRDRQKFEQSRGNSGNSGNRNPSGGNPGMGNPFGGADWFSLAQKKK
jgi:uncharacterized protein